MTIRSRHNSATMAALLLLMAIAIMADGLTTFVAINFADLGESNPLVLAIGEYGPAASLLFRACAVILLYFWIGRRFSGSRLVVVCVALAIVAGLTFAAAIGNALIILAAGIG